VQDEEDFFSEGCLALMDAVTMFNPDRGFQFSTYATTCIRNRLFRLFRERNRNPAEVPLDESSLECEPGSSVSGTHRLDECRRLAEAALHEMPEREQELLRLRFGLDSARQPRSYREVAEEVGLSKERVRQLVNQAILSIQSNLILAPGDRVSEDS
jgi:RNA polymerase primary sigma factor/RNA polymerase sigma factor